MYTTQPLARFSYLAIRPLVLLYCLLAIGLLPLYSAAVPRTSSGIIPASSKPSVVGGASVKSYQYNSERASDDVASLPTVVTTSISDIHLDSAVAHAAITSPGDSPVIDWGFVWSTSENPTLGMANTANSTEPETFAAVLQNLNQKTTYYVRAFATNSTGTGYGNQLVFRTLSCRYLDSLELVKLYHATGGPNWFYTWDLSTPINTWYGVSLNAEGCVTGIYLSYNNLAGTIFDFQMSSLITFDLSSNQLTGSVPNFSTPSLQSFYLNSNQLTGSVPNFSSPSLESFYLDGNQLTGNVPNFNTPNLQSFGLTSNELTGSVPNFSSPNLYVFYLYYNQLTGSIPNFSSPSLESFYLDGNQLTGSVPNFSTPNLRWFILSNNQLTGSVPNFSTPSLQSFDLSNNQLTGSVPDFNTPNLYDFNLSSNQLTGSVPNFSASNLQSFSLSYNQLTGSVPNFNTPSLQSFDLSSNQLTGSVPNFSSPSLRWFNLNRIFRTPSTQNE